MQKEGYSLEDTAKLTKLMSGAGRGAHSPQSKLAGETAATLSSLILLTASEAIACMSASNGMPWNESYALTAKVMAETANLLSEKGMHPAQLKDTLCQPGTLAIETLQALEQVRLRVAMINACNEAYNQISQNQEGQEDTHP